MNLPSASKIDSIQNELNETLEKGVIYLKAKNDSFVKIVEDKIFLLRKEITSSVQALLELNKTYETLKTEVATLEGKRDIMKDWEEKLNIKSVTLDRQEEDLLTLHKTLVGKSNVLKNRENELNEKERGLKDREGYLRRLGIEIEKKGKPNVL